MPSFTFPLPLACAPPDFAPAWHEFADDSASTFLYSAAPAAGLLTALRTPAASLAPLATVDLVHDVVGSGRLAPAALARLHAAAASGAPWWLVVHNLEGVDSGARAVNGGNLLMMLLERRAGANHEGLDLTRSAALLLAADGSDVRALKGRWGALAAQAQQASRGQTLLNPEALFARIGKADFPSGSGGMAQWNAALHSPACRGARGAAGRAHHTASGSSLASAALYALYACAGLALLAVVAIAVLYLVGGARAAPGSSGSGSSGSGGSSGSSGIGGKVALKNVLGAARQRGNSRPPSPSRGSGARA
jgi:hypothetical protein